MIDIDKFNQLGYGVFNIEDILSTDKISEFNLLADKIMLLPVNNDYYRCTMSIRGFHNDPEWPHVIDFNEIDDKLKKVKENNLKITQHWLFSNNTDLLDKFQNLFNEFLIKLYPEFGTVENNSIKHLSSITLYREGDYTEPHRDGQNQGRVCALLVYLTPSNLYNNGGELVIYDNDNGQDIITINPTRGNVVVLDFNNHNLYHGVNAVVNNFQRYCFLSFVLNLNKVTGH